MRICVHPVFRTIQEDHQYKIMKAALEIRNYIEEITEENYNHKEPWKYELGFMWVHGSRGRWKEKYVYDIQYRQYW